jgi:hypothetical protein
MYYTSDPTTVEADDIVKIEHMEIVQQEEDGLPPRLIVTYALDPFKTYTPEKMHLTNGVTHRLLVPDKTTLTSPKKDRGKDEDKKKNTAEEQDNKDDDKKKSKRSDKKDDEDKKDNSQKDAFNPDIYQAFGTQYDNSPSTPYNDGTGGKSKSSDSDLDTQTKYELDVFEGNASQYAPDHQHHNPQNSITTDDRIGDDDKDDSKKEKSDKKRKTTKETKDTDAPDDSGSQHQGSLPTKSTKPEEETYGKVLSSDDMPG